MAEYYPLIIDIITAFVGLLIIYGGYKKGFIRSVILVIGYVFSIFLSIYLSKIVAGYLFDNFLRGYMIENINKTITANTGQLSLSGIVPIILSKLPKSIIIPILGNAGGQKELVQSIVEKADGSFQKLGEVITDSIFSPIIIPLLEVIACLIIFILCTIIVKIISKIFRGIYGIPIIGPINSILGAILGIVQAIIAFYILAMVISLVITLTANELPWINDEVMKSTYILKHFLY